MFRERKEMAHLVESVLKIPRVISAEDFVHRTKKDPSWCKFLTERLVVEGEVHLDKANTNHIAQLSPFLVFENFANFERQPFITVAEGTFKQGVVFNGCLGLESIGKLEVVGMAPDTSYFTGMSCSFYKCERLRVATGTYPGYVSFADSGVKEIKDLFISPDIQNPGRGGAAATFDGCMGLRVATGTYPGSLKFAESGVTEIRDLHILNPDEEGEAIDLSGCGIQKISNFKYNGEIFADDKTLAKIQQLQGQDKAGGKGEFDDLF